MEPDALKVERTEIPVPQAGEVLVKVEAFGLNRFYTADPSQGGVCRGVSVLVLRVVAEKPISIWLQEILRFSSCHSSLSGVGPLRIKSRNDPQRHRE
jgi:hypothetical protein